MPAILCLILVSASAILTHVCVRYAAGKHRFALFAAAMALLCASFYPGEAFGGFWAGFYTLLSVYFLACMALPWLDLFLEQRRAR